MGFPCVASLDGNPLFHELVLVVAVVVAVAVVNVVNLINHNKPTYHLGMVHTIHFLGLPSLFLVAGKSPWPSHGGFPVETSSISG